MSMKASTFMGSLYESKLIQYGFIINHSNSSHLLNTWGTEYREVKSVVSPSGRGLERSGNLLKITYLVNNRART